MVQARHREQHSVAAPQPQQHALGIRGQRDMQGVVDRGAQVDPSRGLCRRCRIHRSQLTACVNMTVVHIAG